MTTRKVPRAVEPEVFSVLEPGRPCTYWSNGKHIVTNGECRCGVGFDVKGYFPVESEVQA